MNMIHTTRLCIGLVIVTAGFSVAPAAASPSVEARVMRRVALLRAVIGKLEFYAVAVDAERRFSYGAQKNRVHVFVRLVAGAHSGWAEMNLGFNKSGKPTEAWIRQRIQFFRRLKGKRVPQALKLVIGQRDKESSQVLEVADLIGGVNRGYRRQPSAQSIDDIVESLLLLRGMGLSACEDPAAMAPAQWTELQRRVGSLDLVPDVPMRTAWKALRNLDPSMGV